MPHVHRGLSPNRWIYNEGCDEEDGCPTRDPLPRPALARQRSLCPGAYAHLSLAALLRAKFKRCRVTAHSSTSNDVSGIQPVLVLLPCPIYLQKLYIHIIQYDGEMGKKCTVNPMVAVFLLKSWYSNSSK